MTNTGDRQFDGKPDRRKDVELRALIDSVEAYQRNPPGSDPEEIRYWRELLAQKHHELAAELAEVTEHAA